MPAVCCSHTWCWFSHFETIRFRSWNVLKSVRSDNAARHIYYKSFVARVDDTGHDHRLATVFLSLCSTAVHAHDFPSNCTSCAIFNWTATLCTDKLLVAVCSRPGIESVAPARLPLLPIYPRTFRHQQLARTPKLMSVKLETRLLNYRYTGWSGSSSQIVYSAKYPFHR